MVVDFYLLAATLLFVNVFSLTHSFMQLHQQSVQAYAAGATQLQPAVALMVLLLAIVSAAMVSLCLRDGLENIPQVSEGSEDAASDDIGDSSEESDAEESANENDAEESGDAEVSSDADARASSEDSKED